MKSGTQDEVNESDDGSIAVAAFPEIVLERLLGKDSKQYHVLQQSLGGGSSYLPQSKWSMPMSTVPSIVTEPERQRELG